MVTYKQSRCLDFARIAAVSVSLVTMVWGRTEPLDNPRPANGDQSPDILCVAVDLYQSALRTDSIGGIIQDNQSGFPSCPFWWAGDIGWPEAGTDVLVRSSVQDAIRLTPDDSGDASVEFAIPRTVEYTAYLQHAGRSESRMRAVPRHTEFVYLMLTAIGAGTAQSGKTLGEVTLRFSSGAVESYDLVLGEHLRNWYEGTRIYVGGVLMQEILYVSGISGPGGDPDALTENVGSYTPPAPGGTQNLSAHLDMLRIRVPPNRQAEELWSIRVATKPLISRGQMVSMKVMGISTGYLPPKLVFRYPDEVLHDCSLPQTPVTADYPATLSLVSKQANTPSDQGWRRRLGLSAYSPHSRRLAA